MLFRSDRDPTTDLVEESLEVVKTFLEILQAALAAQGRLPDARGRSGSLAASGTATTGSAGWHAGGSDTREAVGTTGRYSGATRRDNASLSSSSVSGSRALPRQPTTAAAVAGSPLANYIAEVMSLIETGDTPRGEILVERVKPLRQAESSGNWDQKIGRAHV